MLGPQGKATDHISSVLTNIDQYLSEIGLLILQNADHECNLLLDPNSCHSHTCANAHTCHTNLFPTSAELVKQR